MNLFLTVFLGLVVGPVTVELQPPAGTEHVRVLVDGDPVAEVAGEPWRAEVDFGSRLTPHLLEAEAFDGQGEILARDRQWVNLPSGPARAGIALREHPEFGMGLSLSWAHVLGYEPTRVRLEIDGKQVAIGDSSWVRVPETESELTLVRLEVEFPDYSIANQDVVLRAGRLVGTDVELTAVPIRDRPPAEIGRPLTGVTVNGATPELLALETGPAQVVMVVDPTVVVEFGDRLDETALERRESRAGQGIGFVEGVTVLADDDWVRFVWPVATRAHPTSDQTQIFDYSRDLTRRDGDLVEIMRRTVQPESLARSEVRLADAVAVAGLLAASRSRRRAVILVTDAEGGSSTVSEFTPREVRSFLADLRVPLLVWSPGKAAVSGWGRARRLDNPRAVERAIAELRRIVDRQRIAWIGGLHLPQEITVSGRRRIHLGDG